MTKYKIYRGVRITYYDQWPNWHFMLGGREFGDNGSLGGATRLIDELLGASDD